MFLLSYLILVLPLLVSSSEIVDVISDVPIGDAIGSIERRCLRKTNAKKEDLIMFHDVNHMKDSREARCMMACIAEAWKTLDDQGGPVVNHLDLYFKAQFHPEDLDMARKIWMDCFASVTKENIPDHCDYWFKFLQCFIDGVNEEKLEKVKFWDV